MATAHRTPREVYHATIHMESDDISREIKVDDPDYPFGIHYFVVNDADYDPFYVRWCEPDLFEIISPAASIQISLTYFEFIQGWIEKIEKEYRKFEKGVDESKVIT